jgi:tartrate-resistant acid phosphatase type 5
LALLITHLNSCFKKGNNDSPGQVISHEGLQSGYLLCILGDTGMDSLEQGIVADALAKEGCDQVRHTGDMIYPSGLENENDPKFMSHFYKYYSPIMERGVPFHISVGNHDYKKNARAWIKLAKSHKNIRFPSMYSMDIYKNICLITIDTNSAFIQQYIWLKKLRATYSEKCKLTLAFGHHPRYSSGKHGDAKFTTKVFLDSVISGKVDGYFAGHDHNLEDVGVIDGTHHFVSGAGAKLRPIASIPKKWALSKLGYQTLSVYYKNGKPLIKFFFYEIDSETKVKKLVHSGELDGKGFRK